MVIDPSEPEIVQACFDQEEYSNTVYGGFIRIYLQMHLKAMALA